MDLSREDEYFEWVDNEDIIDVPPRIIRQPEISSLQLQFINMEMDDEDDEIEFPTYDNIGSSSQDVEDLVDRYDEQVEYYLQSPSLQPQYIEDDDTICDSPTLMSSSSPLEDSLESSEPCEITETVDDTAIQVQPSHHVDYLAHDWPEEDLWSSWKFIHSNRGTYDNSERLENASWRCWAKMRLNLKTISPDVVEWQKEHDTTWLYGPLQKSELSSRSKSRGNLTRSVSYIDVDVKPILKKRSPSDIILQRSSSSITNEFLSEASTPSLISGRSSPSSNTSRKCVRFHDEVEQFIAVNNTINEVGLITTHNQFLSTIEESPIIEKPIIESSSSEASKLNEKDQDKDLLQPSKACTRIVAKLPNTALKYVNPIKNLTNAVQNLRCSLTSYDYFCQPQSSVDSSSSGGGNYQGSWGLGLVDSGRTDDDEWESEMIGVDLVTSGMRSFRLGTY